MSGSPDLTPGRVFSDGLFGQKSHGGQSGSTETVDLRDNEEIVEISLDASGESSKSKYHILIVLYLFRIRRRGNNFFLSGNLEPRYLAQNFLQNLSSTF